MVSAQGSRTRARIVSETLRRGRAPLAILVLMVLAGSGLSIVAPIVLGDSIAGILGQSSAVTLSFSGLRTLLLVGIGALLVQFFNQILRKTFDRSFLDNWIPRVCEKMSRVDLRILDSFEAGYLNRRIASEIYPVPTLFSVEVPGLIESVLVLAASLVMLIVLLPGVTLVLVAAGLLLLPAGIFVARRSRALMKEILEKRSQLEGATTNLVVSQYQLRAFSADGRMCDHVSGKVRQATRVDLRNTLRMLFYMACLAVLTIGGMIAFLLYAEGSPGIATAEVGTVVAFLAYLALFAGRLGGVTTVIGKIQGSIASLDRMAEFLDLPETAAERQDRKAGMSVDTIEVMGLSGSIDGHVIFENVSFSARKGEIVAIRGQSGAGKTTLLKTLFGLHPRSNGSILVNGKPVDGLRDLGDPAVLLPQDIRFFNGSIEWNMEMLSGSAPDGERLSSVFRELHLDDRLDSGSPAATDITDGGSNISGGEKQRLALAAVILRNPQVLLLDEPTSQLDVDTEDLILETVKELAEKGTIVLIVTHNENIDHITDRTVTLGRPVQ